MRSSLRIPNLSEPCLQGARELPIDFQLTVDQTATGIFAIAGDLVQELESGALDFVQSIYIDNSRNPEQFRFNIAGVGNSGQTITAAPFSQGYYAVTPEYGSGFRFVATINSTALVPCILYNVPLPYFSWPCVGQLTPLALEFAPLAIGDNTLVAAVAGKGIRTYRIMFTVSVATNIKFFNGASANNLPLSGTFVLFAGGSLTWPVVDNVPWLKTTAGNALVMTSSAGANLGGIIDFVQV